jgi:3-hydroxy-9,10-secoandrosta-1,3,5(10)-triene-9,17-dione monooxygenase
MDSSPITEQMDNGCHTPVRDPVASQPVEAVTHASLVAQARALTALLQEDATRADQQRCLTDRAVAALEDAGLFRLFTPQAQGGYEASIGTLLDVCTELARGCSSTAWVASVLNVGNYMAALFPREAQHDVWGDNPDAKTALVIVASRAAVERVEGGVIVTGQWPYASGARHCDWLAALIPRGVDSDDPAVHIVLMRADELRIEDTWHVTGMRGTGSVTVVADRVFIPRHRVMPYAPRGRATAWSCRTRV